MRTPTNIVAAVLVLSLAVLACSSEEETKSKAAVPTAPEATAPVTADPVSEALVEEPLEPVAITVRELQDKVPEDLPFYPSERLEAAEELELKGDSEVGVTLQTRDSIEDVVTYYRDVSQNQGWEIEMDVSDESSGVIEAWKGDRKLIVLTVSNGVDPTLIAVKIMTKPRF